MTAALTDCTSLAAPGLRSQLPTGARGRILTHRHLPSSSTVLLPEGVRPTHTEIEQRLARGVMEEVSS